MFQNEAKRQTTCWQGLCAKIRSSFQSMIFLIDAQENLE